MRLFSLLTSEHSSTSNTSGKLVLLTLSDSRDQLGDFQFFVRPEDMFGLVTQEVDYAAARQPRGNVLMLSVLSGFTTC